MLVGVAIDVPEPWGSQLTRRRAAAGDSLAEHIPAHLTLLPPTEVDAARIAEIEQGLAAVAARHRPFTLQLRGTGSFRPVTQVVFVRVAAGTRECVRLAEEMRAVPAVPREARFPYHPHVTVAQDVPTEALDMVYRDLANFSARYQVSAFTLFEYEAQGRWRARREFRLGEAAQ